jgi:hypothetical protein
LRAVAEDEATRLIGLANHVWFATCGFHLQKGLKRSATPDESGVHMCPLDTFMPITVLLESHP